MEILKGTIPDRATVRVNVREGAIVFDILEPEASITP